MKAIYIRETTACPYATAIVKGYKICESRNRNTLKTLVGERVAIVRTKAGKPSEVVGYVTITSAIWVDKQEFDRRFTHHCVPSGSRFDCNGKGKWLYYLSNPVECNPYPVHSAAVRHGRVWCEF